jgi:hypothetical protein
VRAGDLFIEVKIVGADKATTALAKVDKELKTAYSLSRDLTKSAKEVFASAGDMGGVMRGTNSALSSIGGFLGPVGKVAAVAATAAFGMYEFAQNAGELGVQMHALKTLTGFPGELATQYEHAAVKMGAAAGTMTGAIFGLSQMSYNARNYGVIPPEIMQLERFSGEALTQGTVEDPKKMLEYVIRAMQSKNNGMDNMMKAGIMSSVLHITDPAAQAAIIEGRMSQKEIAKYRGYPDKQLEHQRGLKEDVNELAWQTKFAVTKGGLGALNVGKMAVDAANVFINHPKDIVQPYNKNSSTKLKGGIPIQPKGKRRGKGKLGFNSEFPLNENNILKRSPSSLASNTTNNIGGDKTTHVNVQLSTTASADEAAQSIFRTAHLLNAQVSVT